VIECGMSPDSDFLSPVVVRSLYYNGELNKTWGAYLLAQEPERLVVVRAHGSPNGRPGVEPWTPPGAAIEVYSTHDWYNVYYILNGDGSLLSYYVNIAMPPVLEEGTLSYVNLDLDLGIAADLTHTIYDEEEFREHSVEWNYPPEVRERALATFELMLERLEARHEMLHDWVQYLPMVPREWLEGVEGARYP
jgi:protein associated with RNAse G/E